MKKYRIDLVSIEAADQKKITAMQQKINQWMTTGVLKKFQIHTTASHVVFNICRIKEQGE